MMIQRQPDRSSDSAPRVLVVEDDGDQRQLICEALAIYYQVRADDRIVGVASAAECLAQDLAGYDIVLLDYHLPDMRGLDLLDRVVKAADVPVIFVTGENDTARAVEAIQRGAQDYVVKLGDYLFALPIMVCKSIRQHLIRKENERLQRELQMALGELQEKNVQLQESLAKLEAMATTDHLTGLANRRRFGEVLDRYYSEADRYGFDLTCCMCDLDDFKHLNDALGHQIGDEILVKTAEVIRSSLRSTDIAARYGGDEFVLLLPHTSLDRGREVGKRIRELLADETRNHPKVTRPVTMSIGIASLRAVNPGSGDAMVSMADRALYAAKAQGKDRIVVFGELLDPAALKA